MFIFCLGFTIAQTPPSLTKRQRNQSQKDLVKIEALVTAITAGKSSEAEKFEAIFKWVTKNIRYDYNVYYSSGGAGKTDVYKILRKRKGICLDYSTLMDSLCSRAGITSVSVYGYAKDNIFDVNDSLYIDNHAWNVVRIANKWYVYDATWASGHVSYEYSLFSKLLLRIFEKIEPKYKKKKLTGKDIFPNSDCGNEPAYYYKQKIFNLMLLRILNLFHLKIREVYVPETNKRFFLTDPKVFSITHFPDNPIWALHNKTIREFERDSAFYHLDNLAYTLEVPEGKDCNQCDSSILLDEISELQFLKNASLKSNPRNRFITALCEYQIGQHYLEKSRETSDLKNSLLDSCLLYTVNGEKSLKQCRKNIELDYKLQKKKNLHKQDLLFKDNKTHRAFLKSKVKLVLAESRHNRELSNKTKAGSVKLRKRKNTLRHLKTNVNSKVSKKRDSKKITRLSNEYDNQKRIHDSLSLEIENKKTTIDLIFANVLLNVWQKATHFDSLIEPFKLGKHYRGQLRDNYKKEVVELRKRIPIYERNYSEDLETILFSPSQTGVAIGNDLVKLLDTRYNLERQIFKTATELIKYEELTVSVLEELKTQMEIENNKNYCWLEAKTKVITSTYMGFDFLNLQQKKIEVAINFENDKERFRLHTIDKELKRRRTKYRNIVSHNSNVVKHRKKEITKLKRQK